MDLKSTKKRKITDYFPPLPSKVQSRAGTVEGKITQGTQTDGAYEIESMKKEGLKFLVSRFFNYESKRAMHSVQHSFRMCSIADDHFFLKSDAKETSSAACDSIDEHSHDFISLCNRSLDYLRTIQKKNYKTYYETWEEKIQDYLLESEELNPPSKNSIMVDEMTQYMYGEDNSDEDFFEGMKFMAIKIIEHQSKRLDVRIDDDYMSDWGPSYCNRCCDLGCRHNHLDDVESWAGYSDDNTEYDSDDSSCPCTSTRCDCEECDCARNKRFELEQGYNYQKYQVWRSETPGQG